MAQKGVQLDRESFSCSVCLNLLTDPVTTPCGHSYCMNCIRSFWDREDEKEFHSCPLCRQTFSPRPALHKNTMLAVLVEELKKTGLKTADDSNAGPEDVACDFCIDRKMKALKSCLVCLVSYCGKHLQPHYESPTFQKHKLVEPTKNLHENICSRHNEVMKMFCRTDKVCICYLCPVDEHKGHDTVSAAAERNDRQRELEVSQQKIQQRTQDREKDLELLHAEMQGICRSADKVVDDVKNILTELISLLEKRSSDMEQQVRSQQEAEVGRVRELQKKLEQEIAELKRTDAEMEKLLHTEDHNQFLHIYPSISAISETTDTLGIKVRPLRYFEDVTAAESEVRDKLKNIMSEKWTNILATVTKVDVLLPPPEPQTRAEFLRYACELTLDPNTANTQMALSEGNKRATLRRDAQPYYSHPERFLYCCQAMSRESLTGRCYWEVQRKGRLYLGVIYKTISRAVCQNLCGLGSTNQSWALKCEKDSVFEFYHNNVLTPVTGPRSSRIGVYLDHSAGVLSFYSVSQTMTLLHRVQTTFKQPLYAGIRLYWNYGDIAEFVHLK